MEKRDGVSGPTRDAGFFTNFVKGLPRLLAMATIVNSFNLIRENLLGSATAGETFLGVEFRLIYKHLENGGKVVNVDVLPSSFQKLRKSASFTGSPVAVTFTADQDTRFAIKFMLTNVPEPNGPPPGTSCGPRLGPPTTEEEEAQEHSHLQGVCVPKVKYKTEKAEPKSQKAESSWFSWISNPFASTDPLPEEEPDPEGNTNII